MLCITLGLYGFTKAVASNFLGLFGELPSFEVLENPKSDLATEIYSADGHFLGSYYSTNRKHLEFHQISKEVLKCLYATEDIRYEMHSGIDMRSTFRAIKGIATGNSAGGGSTLSQQVAKNLFSLRTEKKYLGPAESWPNPFRMIVKKAREWIIATRLESNYTKKEIITMYLNTVSFGTKATGIESGAKNYFDKIALDLNTQEAAVLIGTLAANTKYDPDRNYDNSFERRNTVIGQLKNYNFITELEKDSLIALPIVLNLHEDNYNSGLATYFRSYTKKDIEKLVQDQGYNLYTDGLKIYTTIDYKLQQIAEQELEDHLNLLQKQLRLDWGKSKPWTNQYIIDKLKTKPKYKIFLHDHKDNEKKALAELKKPIKTKILTYKGEKDTLISPFNEWQHYNWMLRSGTVSIDPKTGNIKAWVGGMNQKYFSYDHVGQGKRQPGSTFKAILYATAIMNGYSPCSELLDAPVSIKLDNGQLWTPKAKPTGQSITLKVAMARSINNMAALLIKDIGPQNVIDQAKRFGIDTKDMQAVHSLALGTSPVNLLELTAAYSVFANQGNYIEPNYILKIEDKFGKLIYTKESPIQKRVMSEYEAYEMAQMLREGALYNKRINGKYYAGTSRRLVTEYHLDKNYNQIGGKTGTTQNSADGWYMGITPVLVTGTWTGGIDNKVHFQNSSRGRKWGQGARMAMPIFANTMQKAYEQKIITPAQFTIPKNISSEQFDTEIRCINPSDDLE